MLKLDYPRGAFAQAHTSNGYDGSLCLTQINNSLVSAIYAEAKNLIGNSVVSAIFAEAKTLRLAGLISGDFVVFDEKINRFSDINKLRQMHEEYLETN